MDFDDCRFDGPGELRKFVAPEFIFGVGARDLVGGYAAHLGARHVMVVTDAGVQAAGWAEEAIGRLEEAGLTWTLFADVSPNPRVGEVMAGVERYRAAGCDGLLAVGGGSPIDCAKGIGAAFASNRPVTDFEGVDRVVTSLPPLICIPTTAGSAADISQFAILSDPSQGRKLALISKALVPDLSLVDPACTVTMSPYLTACTAMDVLSHAMESYVSTGHSPVTDLHALEAVRLVGRTLPRVMADGDDMEARIQMSLASLQAGLAFSNASLGLIHSMAHVIGGRLDVAHGECNAMLLAHVVDFNFGAVPERYRCIAGALGMDVKGVDDAGVRGVLCEAVQQLRRNAGITRTLGDVGVRPGDLAAFAADAMRDACIVTNPRVPSRQDVEAIYERAL